MFELSACCLFVSVVFVELSTFHEMKLRIIQASDDHKEMVSRQMWFVHEERNILIENASERVDEARQTMKLISQSCRDYIAMRTTPLQLYIPPPYVT